MVKVAGMKNGVAQYLSMAVSDSRIGLSHILIAPNGFVIGPLTSNPIIARCIAIEGKIEMQAV